MKNIPDVTKDDNVDTSCEEAVEKKEEFKKELGELINKHSIEDGSDTPDYLLAEYLCGCLEQFNNTVMQREGYYNRQPYAPPICGGEDGPVSPISDDNKESQSDEG